MFTKHPGIKDARKRRRIAVIAVSNTKVQQRKHHVINRHRIREMTPKTLRILADWLRHYRVIQATTALQRGSTATRIEMKAK
jgi:hypothetical protein